MASSVDSESDGYDSDPNNYYDYEMGCPMMMISQTRREVLAWLSPIPGNVFDGIAPSLVTMLARPRLPESLIDQASLEEDEIAGHSPKLHPDSKAARKFKSTQATITDLPLEIFQVILNYLTVDDVFYLGLTCRSLWKLAKGVVKTFILEHLGTWAGTQLVCAPAIRRQFKSVVYVKIRTFASAHDANESDTTINHSSLSLRDVNKCRYRTVKYDHVKAKYPHVLASYPKPNPFASGPITWLGGAGAPSYDRRIRYPAPSPYFPDSRCWILRNLTTREYVRADAVALKPEFIQGPFIAGLGFGEVLASRIVWMPPTSMWTFNDNDNIMTSGRDYGPSFYWGPWAGHRFDIVPETDLQRDYEGGDGGNVKEERTEIGGEWRDVSEEVMADMARIAQTRFGENWKDVLVREVDRLRWGGGLVRYRRDTEKYVLRKQENYL